MIQQVSYINDTSKLLQSSQNITTIRKNKNNMSNMLSPTTLFLSNSCMLVVFIGLFFVLIDSAACDYENTWNFYYEQPCCGSSSSSSGPHHLRHHRGKCSTVDSGTRPFYINRILRFKFSK